MWHGQSEEVSGVGGYDDDIDSLDHSETQPGYRHS